jgi:hypothetical protein
MKTKIVEKIKCGFKTLGNYKRRNELAWELSSVKFQH